jgi:methylphosphotriester-DNA--protein-cysteine methyltransferase
VEWTEYAQTDEATEISCSTLANDMEPWKPDFELLRRAQLDEPGGEADMEFFRHMFGLSPPEIAGQRRLRISRAHIDSQRRAMVEVDVQSLQALYIKWH